MFKYSLVIGIMSLYFSSVNAEIIKFQTMTCSVQAAALLAATHDPYIRKSKQYLKIEKMAIEEAQKECILLKVGDQVEVITAGEIVSVVRADGSARPMLLLNITMTSGRAM